MVLALAWAGALAACGGGPSRASLKADSADPEDELAQAEATIYARLPSKQGYPATPTPNGTASPGTSPGSTAQGPLPSPPQATESPRHSQSSEDEGTSEGEACEISCDALASMQRAVERICAIAGPTAERCTRARERLTRARETVEAQCEECDA